LAKKISALAARLDTEVDGTEFVILADTDAVYNTVTATTISSSTADDSFSDSANGFAGYKVGTTADVTGFTAGGLNTTYTIATVLSDGSKITVEETLTDTEAAGNSVTIDGLGLNYKMLLSDLAEYTGSAGLPNPVDGATFKDSRYTVHTATSSSFDADDGNVQVRTAAGNETIEITLATSEFSIIFIKYIPGANTISFGTSIDKWIGGVEPSTVEAEHWMSFWSEDDGTTIVGQSLGGAS
jgi:hypothetical protein